MRSSSAAAHRALPHAFPWSRPDYAWCCWTAGKRPEGLYPEATSSRWLFNDREQWRRIIGEDFRALAYQEATSPKMRVPGLAYVFDGFLEANRITTKDFVAIGSLAVGGLSAAWGCGVARVDQTELATFPCDPEVMLRSYARVARRIGISGATDDDLRDFFGVDEWAQPPIALDPSTSRYTAPMRNIAPGC